MTQAVVKLPSNNSIDKEYSSIRIRDNHELSIRERKNTLVSKKELDWILIRLFKKRLSNQGVDYIGYSAEVCTLNCNSTNFQENLWNDGVSFVETLDQSTTGFLMFALRSTHWTGGRLPNFKFMEDIFSWKVTWHTFT